MKTIEIFTLKEISYVPSARTCDSYAEAAAVCLENQGHQKGVAFKIEGEKNVEIQLDWLDIDQKIKDVVRFARSHRIWGDLSSNLGGT